MNLTLKDMLSIFAFTVGPLGTLMLIMWHHFNGSIHNLRGELKGELKELSGKIDRVDEKLSQKIDAVSGRVSRIEGLLIFAKIMPSEIMLPSAEIKPKEVTDQEIKPKEVTDQKEVVEDIKGVTVSHAQKLQQEGRQESTQQIVNRMLQDNQPIDKIILWTGISKDSIKKLAFG